MPPQSTNPYDFITSAPQGPQRNFGPSSKKQRILIIILGGSVVLVLAIVIISFLGKAGQAQNQKLIELAQTQTEIVRIAAIGTTKATNLQTKSLAVNTQLSVESSKQQTKQALKNRKVKVADKVLAESKNTKTDTLLQEAASNNRFNETFSELIQTKLQSYQKQAKAVYESSTSTEQKNFQAGFNAMGLLVPKTSAQE